VVGSIVVGLNPLSCESLAAILEMHVDKVRTSLRRLHSVFIIPESNSKPIRICHKSFSDYLQDKTRCKDVRFYINPLDHHLQLGLCCVQMMNTLLKKNICGISHYTMNADIRDIGARRKNHIGDWLEYGCRSWGKHLRLALRDGDNVRCVVELLKEFFDHHLLEWLEVLSIVGDLHSAVYSLHDVTSWLVDVSVPTLSFLSRC
jgi:hypothetical protein